MAEGKILGIWDGHDAGAALIDAGGNILSAVNEERLSRKKLHTGFPYLSIESCLEIAETSKDEITDIAFSTTDLAKTASRLIPSLSDGYYLFRRRKIDRPPFHNFRRYMKFTVTQPAGPRAILGAVNNAHLSHALRKMGFKKFKLHSVDHHLAHAASAYHTSGMDNSVCITMDGLGDGVSSTVNHCADGKIVRLGQTTAGNSIGIFFEQATTVLGMRELEDEGKLMSLADYSHKTGNKMDGLFSVSGLSIKARLNPIAQYRFLERLAWRTPPEDFARMVQETLEKNILGLFSNAQEETGARKISWSGGIASNIKLNQGIRSSLSLKDWFVFPHMGDGGLALGAALFVAGNPQKKKLKSVYFGPGPKGQGEILEFLEKNKAKFSWSVNRKGGWQKEASEILSKEKDYFFLFQGRMEYGPRALGNRSIVAPADSIEVKNKLNLRIKERNWYQPFCPSILATEARKLFSDYDGVEDKFMTMGYSCTPLGEKRLAAAIHIDMSARPQMVGSENPEYMRLISTVKRATGTGAVLNTSFNYHGDPIVSNIKEALEMQERTKTRHMFAEGIHIEFKGVGKGK